MKNNKFIKIDEIAQELNKSSRTTRRYIASLSNKAIIKRAVSKKKGYWEINNKVNNG